MAGVAALVATELLKALLQLGVVILGGLVITEHWGRRRRKRVLAEAQAAELTAAFIAMYAIRKEHHSRLKRGERCAAVESTHLLTDSTHWEAKARVLLRRVHDSSSSKQVQDAATALFDDFQRWRRSIESGERIFPVGPCEEIMRFNENFGKVISHLESLM